MDFMNALSLFAKWSLSLAPAAILLAESVAARAADVIFYAVAKDEGFDQLSAGPPTPKGNPYRFNTTVGLTTANAVNSATVQLLPGGPVYPLSSDTYSFDFQAKFTSLSALNAAAPSGTYRLVINAVHDGNHTINLLLTGDAYPPTDPHISNYAAAQAINPAAAFTLMWDAFSGGTANDFIQVLLVDISSGATLFQTPDPGQPGGLTGTATSLVVPANTLPPAMTLGAQLLFARAVTVDSTSYPGVIGFASYYKFTQFNVTTTAPLPAQDVSGYSIAKQRTFNQNDSGQPVADAAVPYRFLATVIPTSASSVSNLTVQLPGGASDPLTYNAANAFYRFQQSALTQSALDAAFSPGVYTLRLNGVHDGLRTLPLTLPAASFPNAPRVSNFTGAQSINPAVNFNMTWDAFSGATATDDILLDVSDSSGSPVSSAPLTGTVTNFNFPANAFRAAQTYQATLNFRKFANRDTTTYPGATGSVIFSSRTFFNIVTAAPSAPRLAVIAPGAAGQFELQLIGQAGQQYVIEGSTNLQAGSWGPVITNIAGTGQFSFTDSQSSTYPVRFYRGRTVN